MSSSNKTILTTVLCLAASLGSLPAGLRSPPIFGVTVHFGRLFDCDARREVLRDVRAQAETTTNETQ